MINLSNQKDISCSVGPLWAVAVAGCIWRAIGRAALRPQRGHTPPSVTPYAGSAKLYPLDFLCKGIKENSFLAWIFFFQLKHTAFLNSQPLNVVFWLLGNEMDPLQDIGYVIYAPFLDVQDLWGPVQIHHSISRLGQQIKKTLGGEVQGGVVTRFLR